VQVPGNAGRAGRWGTLYEDEMAFKVVNKREIRLLINLIFYFAHYPEAQAERYS
jgi:hypothetical protein